MINKIRFIMYYGFIFCVCYLGVFRQALFRKTTQKSSNFNFSIVVSDLRRFKTTRFKSS